MNLEVSHIVREVVAEIERRQRAETAGAASSTRAIKAKPAAPCEDGRELVVCSRVVSLAEIGDRLGQIRRLVVPRGAVITPAARDALDDRQIAIEFGTADGNATATAARLVLVTARTKYDAGGLASGLVGEGISVETQTSDCLIQTVDGLAGRVADGATLGVVLTPHVAAAVCLANRVAGVRAIAAADPATAVEAARAVGANVLVADPRGKGLYQLKQLASAFCRGGPWACPEVLRPRLG